MTSPAVTYTFVNNTTADAGQVNQNFTDIINALTDSTKSFSIDALTVTGNLQVDGNTTIGSSGGDDITINGSIASTIAVKTTASYNFGSSTFAMLSFYLGRNSQTTRVIGSSAMSATWTMELPPNAGTNKLALVTDGSGTCSWGAVDGPYTRANYGISASVAANALTIDLVGANGSAISTTNPVAVAFRNATITTGTPSVRLATAATTITVPSGATLGTANAVASDIYVYAIDNAGTIELAVTLKRQTDEGAVISTTVMNTSSDVATTIYSTTARSNVAFRFLGKINITEATAGTWASSHTNIKLYERFATTEPSVTTYTSGSGTYTTPAGALWLEVEMVGAGGGGAGSGTGGDGGSGGASSGNTTFGDATAAGGTGGACANGASGAGGAATIGTGTGIAVAGSGGGAGTNNSGGQAPGGGGGVSPLGGAGWTTANNNANAASPNSGSGGAGGSNSLTTGAGGGAGGYIRKKITSSLAASYSYDVATGGAGGTAGTAGSTGSAGGSGFIMITAYFQ